MSVAELFEDVVEGNETHAWARVQDWWSGTLKPDLKSFIAVAETTEGKILQNAVEVGVKDVETAGFSTASFVTAGKDILASLIAQNISQFNIQHVIAMLNIAAAPLAPATSLPTPVTDAPVPETAEATAT